MNKNDLRQRLANLGKAIEASTEVLLLTALFVVLGLLAVAHYLQ